MSNKCVCCGSDIPEGGQVCKACWSKVHSDTAPNAPEVKPDQKQIIKNIDRIRNASVIQLAHFLHNIESMAAYNASVTSVESLIQWLESEELIEGE